MAKTNQKKVFEFDWEGVNQKRATTGGSIEAPTLSQARAILRQRGVRVTKIKRKPKPLFSSSKPIKSVDISFASRQMATMIGAGIPIAQTLRAIGKGHDSQSMEKLMMELAREVESGTSLSNALKKHPKYFNRLFTSLTEAGEESGKLDTMLDRVATYNEKLEAIKSKVKSAMMYPLIVLFVSVVVTILLLLFVIPQFETLFQGVGADLPTLTRIIVDMSEWMQEYWWMFVLGIAGVAVGFVFSYKRSEKLKFTMDRVLIRLPAFGVILQKSALARFARTLSIIFGAGVPLVDGMDTVGASTGNRVYQKAVSDVKADISTGRGLENSMAQTKVFPNMMLQMVASGEESGELEIMLDKVADFYEREVDDAVDALSSIIEPMMIVFLGGIIGTMVLAMYMPIFKMASVF
ncbi:type II secretion system protein F [Arenicella chitinivorans]|uniref:Type II secretion system protein F n=1 Tax=Arenicella chitinivorans TaxID=1329800 RepID=A0A918RQI2_9GAMM|nr:type II secretion system F family protein [Arenicella chitinivorans]GHA05986.1 type II secretion system protein F [Arenicella chitinivorans]